MIGAEFISIRYFIRSWEDEGEGDIIESMHVFHLASESSFPCYRRWKVHAAKHALSVPGPLESSPRIAELICSQCVSGLR